MNVSDLRKLLGIEDKSEIDSPSPNGSKMIMYNNTETAITSATATSASNSSNNSTSSRRQFRVRRQSMEQLDLIKVFNISFCFT